MKKTNLECKYEEANTRMLLHENHESLPFEKIIIRSADTNVLLIAISNGESRIINISDIKEKSCEKSRFEVFGLLDSVILFYWMQHSKCLC